MNKSPKEKSSKTKKNLIEFGVIIGVIAFLYLTGLHVQVIGTMQRGLLWTGIMDAKPAEEITNGTSLSEQDYRFTMITNEDETLSLNDMRGSVIFVNVWASWCPPCIAEMPTIEKLYSELKGHENIRFILLSMDEDKDRAINFMESRRFETPYMFPTSRIPSALSSMVLPTTYVLSKEGQIIYEKQGIADYSTQAFRNWLVEMAKE